MAQRWWIELALACEHPTSGETVVTYPAMAESSAKGVDLQPIEEELRDKIAKDLSEIMSAIRAHRNVSDDAIVQLGTDAATLHSLLRDRGIAVRHHKHMIQNRGLDPDDRQFYEHVHPVEDLLKFLDNVDANTDPEDQTIGHEFVVEIFSRRWGHTDSYRFERTPTGWQIGHMTETSTDKDGRSNGADGTGLYRMLDHDSINYPEELPGYLEYLWEQAAERGLGHDDVHGALKQLADWINLLERASPGGIFRGYK